MGARISSAAEQYNPQNVMTDVGEIARFYDCCTDYMRELLDALARFPDEPRPFPVIEDEMGWPRRRIASVLGGAARMRHAEFQSGRPYRFLSDRQSPSRRWEMWMDSGQARAAEVAARDAGLSR